MQLEKEMEREKDLIQEEVEMLMTAHMMNEESNRIQEKVKQKRAHFAELKAEATKILEDLHF